PAAYEIRFALLGDSFDASLDEASVIADSQGRANVVLHAPNMSTIFRLRASIEGGPSAEAQIAVSDQGFGTVRVLPEYMGTRAVKSWTASVVARAKCADIAPKLPTEPPGALVGTAGAAGYPIIKGAPVGPNLAVTLRAGHYMWGCSDATGLKANDTLD